MAVAADTVTVACKLPNGLQMDIFKMEEFQEQTVLGTRTAQRAIRVGRIRIAGVKRRRDDPGLAMGFALTPNVPRAHWESWLAANQDTPLVRNGIIFAQGSGDRATAQAREHETVRSGQEPLDPRDIPREFRGKVETAEEGPNRKFTG